MAYSDMMSSRLRLSALFALASLGLHQLRYLVVYGQDSGAALAREGHAYLDALAPLAAILFGVALLDLALSLIARRGARSSRRQGWIAITVSLVAVYVCQESLEGVLAAGHAGGLAAAFGHGGWVAVPLAAALGAVVTLGLRGAEAALAHGARARPSRRPSTGPRRRPHPVERPLIGVLAGYRAGRGPPAPSLA